MNYAATRGEADTSFVSRRSITALFVVLSVAVGFAPASAVTTSDGADVDRPYDVVSISSYLIFYRWPHTSENVVCLAIDCGFADDVETVARASDFHLRVLVDASGDARWDLELRLRSRDGELGRLHLFDRRSRRSTSREIKPGKDATLELSINSNDLGASHDLRVWAFLGDGSAGGVERVPDHGALSINWPRRRW